MCVSALAGFALTAAAKSNVPTSVSKNLLQRVVNVKLLQSCRVTAGRGNRLVKTFCHSGAPTAPQNRRVVLRRTARLGVTTGTRGLVLWDYVSSLCKNLVQPRPTAGPGLGTEGPSVLVAGLPALSGKVAKSHEKHKTGGGQSSCSGEQVFLYAVLPRGYLAFRFVKVSGSKFVVGARELHRDNCRSHVVAA